MNRRNRRKMKRQVGTLVNIYRGALSQHDPNYGLKVICYVCGTPHLAGLASIQDKTGTTNVPLCNQCLGAAEVSDPDIPNRIIKKYWNAPDLEVSES